MSQQKQQPKKMYTSNGQMLSSPPLAVRVRGFFDDAMAFGALYLTTLFSLDAFEAASNSPFSTASRSQIRTGQRSSGNNNNNRSGSGWGAGSGGSGSGGGGGGRRLGRIDDVRAPMPMPGSCPGGSCG